MRCAQQRVDSIAAPPMNNPTRRTQQTSMQRRIRDRRHLMRQQTIAPCLQKLYVEIPAHQPALLSRRLAIS
jgi:hypothetical protein